MKEGRGIVVWFLAGTNECSLLQSGQTCSGAHPASYSILNGRFFLQGQSGRLVKVTNQLHLVLPLRTHGSITPFLPYVFMAYNVTNLTLPLPCLMFWTCRLGLLRMQWFGHRVCPRFQVGRGVADLTMELGYFLHKKIFMIFKSYNIFTTPAETNTFWRDKIDGSLSLISVWRPRRIPSPKRCVFWKYAMDNAQNIRQVIAIYHC